MTTTDIGLRAVLDDLSHEIEFARGPGGSWFGTFTMQPLSLNDHGARYLLELGLIDVLDWDEESPTLSIPCRARLSTDGWAIIERG